MYHLKCTGSKTVLTHQFIHESKVWKKLNKWSQTYIRELWLLLRTTINKVSKFITAVLQITPWPSAKVSYYPQSSLSSQSLSLEKAGLKIHSSIVFKRETVFCLWTPAENKTWLWGTMTCADSHTPLHRPTEPSASKTRINSKLGMTYHVSVA